MHSFIKVLAFVLLSVAGYAQTSGVYMFFPKDVGTLSSQIQTDTAAALAASPALGLVIEIPASTVDGGNATTGPAINTSAMQTWDTHLAAIVGNPPNNYKISIVFDSAQGGVGAGGQNTYTPSYVFSVAWASNALCVGCSSSYPQDVAYCHNFQGSSANGWTNSAVGSNVYNVLNYPTGGGGTFDNSGAPLVWEPPFTNWYEQVIPVLINWYKNSSIWKNQMGYFRWGLAAGGGSVVSCPNVMEGTYSIANGGTANQTGFPSPTSQELTRSIWATYHNNIYAAVQANEGSFTHEGSGAYGGGGSLGNGDGSVPLSWADDDYAEAVNYRLAIGTQALSGNATNGDQIEYAAGSPCSEDWCAAFNTYCAGQVGAAAASFCYLQTTSASNPSCLLQPSSCQGGNLTGSLQTVGPFATERHAKLIELAYLEFLCAWSANGSTDNPNCSLVTTPYTPYQTAITNMANGVPSSTASTAGKIVTSNVIGIQ